MRFGVSGRSSSISPVFRHLNPHLSAPTWSASAQTPCLTKQPSLASKLTAPPTNGPKPFSCNGKNVPVCDPTPFLATLVTRAYTQLFSLQRHEFSNSDVRCGNSNHVQIERHDGKSWVRIRRPDWSHMPTRRLLAALSHWQSSLFTVEVPEAWNISISEQTKYICHPICTISNMKGSIGKQKSNL